MKFVILLAVGLAGIEVNNSLPPTYGSEVYPIIIINSNKH